jgi:phage N-6-adenine-methyltransferase
MTSSRSDDWPTQQAFFDKVNEEFGFDLDVCASHENAKCRKYFTKEQDGLAQEWRGVVWCNPPYGRTISDWIKKAYESAQAGATVVLLVPARTDTRWFQDYCLRGGEIRFIRGRLRFGDCKWPAPFPSALVVFRPFLKNTSV